MNEYLIADPAERKERAEDKERWTLEFLRDEIYSTTAILAREMAVGDRAARNVLNRMAKRGLLVKDEVKFMEGRALPLWGITSSGVLEGLTPEEVETVNLRSHRVGGVSPTTIAHTLDVQRCRQHCEIDLDFEDWTPTRLLPAQEKKKNHPDRWSVYPDGVVMQPVKDERLVPVAIEVERSRKTPQRYIQIIRGHIRNIEAKRYFRVYYFCQTKNAAASLQALFLRLMKEKDIGYWVENSEESEKLSPEQSVKLFVFRGMEDF
ncbi:hypothetical protein IMCC21906_03266 (plasmid) [Spongiibacter sp. IMCC21906]|nr:hypothetical protein IMCC21906_03266 [Spongiibacter sp. IMCC21906]